MGLLGDGILRIVSGSAKYLHCVQCHCNCYTLCQSNNEKAHNEENLFSLLSITILDFGGFHLHLLSTSSLLEQRLESVHHLQMTMFRRISASFQNLLFMIVT